ncbi:MAG: SlyX family protein [Gammaproteobacteria bacterium]|nr:SlyX family protein [Gammaproteobacteria bacterium]
MSEEKLITLEEKIAHLQHMLDELNMVVFRQSETIDKLSKRVKELNEKAASSDGTQAGQNIINDDRPPHY